MEERHTASGSARAERRSLEEEGSLKCKGNPLSGEMCLEKRQKKRRNSEKGRATCLWPSKTLLGDENSGKEMFMSSLKGQLSH